eukprot:4184100-Pleurochrysis_carterae.AAC.1
MPTRSYWTTGVPPLLLNTLTLNSLVMLNGYQLTMKLRRRMPLQLTRSERSVFPYKHATLLLPRCSCLPATGSQCNITQSGIHGTRHSQEWLRIDSVDTALEYIVKTVYTTAQDAVKTSTPICPRVKHYFIVNNHLMSRIWSHWFAV